MRDITKHLLGRVDRLSKSQPPPTIPSLWDVLVGAAPVESLPDWAVAELERVGALPVPDQIEQQIHEGIPLVTYGLKEINNE